VSWSPRAFLYKKLLSEEECDHLINHVRCGPDPPSLPCHALYPLPDMCDWHACGNIHAGLRSAGEGHGRQHECLYSIGASIPAW